VTKQQILERVRALIPNFRKRAEAAEQARRLPRESAQEMLDAGLARILMPAGMAVTNSVSIPGTRWCARSAKPMPHMAGARA
jgi:hypothetical protein